jgi:GTPase SAR1 family protein
MATKRFMCYIIGEPGSGKTTLCRELTSGLRRKVKTVPYVSWTHFGEQTMELGHDRETFGGTDALGMAAQKHVLEFLRSGEGADYRYILAEGDRLANGKFFDAVWGMGIDLNVYALLPPTKVIDRRRRARNAAIGKEQDERWLKTRATKVANLVHHAVDPDNRLTQRPDEVLQHLITNDPVCKQLQRMGLAQAR